MLDQRFAVSVHIMTALSCSREQLLTSEYLAESVRTNPTVIRRLLAKLAQAGLVTSFRGKTGGVRLARPAREITLREIYLATSERSLVHVPDKEPRRQCAVSCAMKHVMSDVIEGMENSSLTYLGGIRLSDIAAKIR